MVYLNKIFLFFTVLYLLCFYATNIHAQSITNFSFEENDTAWQKNNSQIEFIVTDSEAKEGTQSAQIKNNSETAYGIEQIVTEIKPSTRYEFSGYIKINNPPPSKTFVRIAWYESANGTGSQIKTNDSEGIFETTDWKKISVITESPGTAHSAKIRLLVSAGQAYFDEIQVHELPPETPHPTPQSTIQPTTSQTISHIYISEVMAFPDTDENEWVELFNNNNFGVTLTNWYIDDVENGGGSPKLFSLEIPAKAYATYELTSSLFNNGGDDVRLLNSEKRVIDLFSYSSALKGYSIGTVSDGTYCIQIPSQNKKNNSCYVEEQDTTPTQTILSPTSKPTVLAAAISKTNVTTTQKPVTKKLPVQSVIESKNNTTEPTPEVEILDLDSDEDLDTKPWLLLSGSYSFLAFISLVSKTFIFRYT